MSVSVGTSSELDRYLAMLEQRAREAEAERQAQARAQALAAQRAADAAAAQAAFRRAEHQDEVAAERQSPSSMTTAQDQTRARAQTWRQAAAADQAGSTPATKAAVDKASLDYAMSIAQQGRIAAWRAAQQGADVEDAVAQQTRFAAGLGGNSDAQADAIAKVVAPVVQAEVKGQSADELALHVQQEGLRLTAPENLVQLRQDLPALAQKQADDAQRVQALAGYGEGYVTQAARHEAADSKDALQHSLAAVAEDQAFDTRLAKLKLDEAATRLAQAGAQGGPGQGSPAAVDARIAPFRAAYDEALQAYGRASADETMTANLLRAMKASDELAGAQQAFDQARPGFAPLDLNAVDGLHGVYTNGYDPTTEILPPADFGDKVGSGNDRQKGTAGTRIVGPDQWQLEDGTTVVRGSDGQWRVRDLQFYTAESDGLARDAYKNGQKMNAEVARLWEARYQAAHAGRDLADAQSAMRSLTTGDTPTLDTDLQQRLADDVADQTDTVDAQKAQDELLQQCTVAGNDAVTVADRRVDLDRQLISWQAAESNWLAAKARGGPDQAAAREAADDAWARVQVADAALADAQASEGLHHGPATPQARDLKDATAARLEATKLQSLLADHLDANQMHDPAAWQKVMDDQARAQAQAEQGKPHKGNRALSILEAVGGGLEAFGGAALIATTGWTGVGGALGVLIVADGAQRIVHGTKDAILDERTNGFITSALTTRDFLGTGHGLGMDIGWAQRIDGTVGLAGSLAGGGTGAFKLLTSESLLARGAAITSTVMLADGASATVFGYTPLASQALTRAGLSETESAYVQMFGGLGLGLTGHFTGGARPGAVPVEPGALPVEAPVGAGAVPGETLVGTSRSGMRTQAARVIVEGGPDHPLNFLLDESQQRLWTHEDFRLARNARAAEIITTDPAAADLNFLLDGQGGLKPWRELAPAERRRAEQFIAAQEAAHPDGEVPLSILLNGKGKLRNGLGHDELADLPMLLEMGHIASAKAGGPEALMLQGAWENQYNNVSIERASLGGQVVSQAAIDIGGIAVDLQTARTWVREGLLDPAVVEQARPVVLPETAVGATTGTPEGFSLDTRSTTTPAPGGQPEIVYGAPHPLAEGINPSGSTTNCVNCAAALEHAAATGQRLRALPGDVRDSAFVEHVLGAQHPLAGGLPELQQVMQEAGPGARAIVRVDPPAPGGTAHVFNAFTDDAGRVLLLDAQNGREVLGLGHAGPLHIMPATPEVEAVLAGVTQPTGAGTAPVGAAAPGHSVHDPLAADGVHQEVMEATPYLPSPGEQAVRPPFKGRADGSDLLTEGVLRNDRFNPKQKAQLSFLLGPSPDGSYPQGSRWAPGLSRDEVAKVFVLSDVAPETLHAGGTLQGLVLQDGPDVVHQRVPEAVVAAKGQAAAGQRPVLMYVVQANADDLAGYLNAGRVPPEALAGAVVVKPDGRFGARTWANRDHSPAIPGVDVAYYRQPAPLSKAAWARIAATQAGADVGFTTAVVAAARAGGAELLGHVIAPAGFAYRSLLPLLQGSLGRRMGWQTEALFSLLDGGAVEQVSAHPLDLQRVYRPRLVGDVEGGVPVGEHAVPTARRATYLDALDTLQRDPQDAAALATLRGSGVDLYLGEWDAMVQRAHGWLPDDRWQALSAARDAVVADPAAADAAAWQVLRLTALDDAVNRHTGWSGAVKGLANPQDFELAAAVLRRNPQDVGARSLLAQAGGAAFAPETLVGGTMAAVKFASFRLSAGNWLANRVPNGELSLYERTALPASAGVPNSLFDFLASTRLAARARRLDVKAPAAGTADYAGPPGPVRQALASWSLLPRSRALVADAGGQVRPTWAGGRLGLLAARLDTASVPVWAVPDLVGAASALRAGNVADAMPHLVNLGSWWTLGRGLRRDMVDTYRGTRGLPPVRRVSRLQWLNESPAAGSDVVRPGLPPALLIAAGGVTLVAPALVPGLDGAIRWVGNQIDPTPEGQKPKPAGTPVPTSTSTSTPTSTSTTTPTGPATVTVSPTTPFTTLTVTTGTVTTPTSSVASPPATTLLTPPPTTTSTPPLRRLGGPQ